MLDEWSGDPGTSCRCSTAPSRWRPSRSRPEEWTISVEADEPGWVIVSQLADPQWTARWIGLDGQGEFDGEILPAFRKPGETAGGWQRVEVPGSGRWTLRLEYDARDVVGGRGDLDRSPGSPGCWRLLSRHVEPAADDPDPRREIETEA